MTRTKRTWFIDSLHLLTDSEWFWHTDLAHHVEQYHVSVVGRFIDHARLRGWVPAQLSDDRLAWIADPFFPEDEA
ncbi:hypothetical protein ABZ642_15085 [Streptomyces sp. NPDC007157]|uniref:hypothetical protein n=1 Tax=Streptomyces sp. NPDC007157 TaxID=3154681 RepID=UPI0033D913A7